VLVLVLVPAAEQPSPASLKRLEHEYALAGGLEAARAARPLELVRYDGRMVLLLEDPGGEPLGRKLGQPLELKRFLHVAIGLAAAVGKVHRHGLIHKDINPANILVDAAGTVRLIGLGKNTLIAFDHHASLSKQMQGAPRFRCAESTSTATDRSATGAGPAGAFPTIPE